MENKISNTTAKEHFQLLIKNVEDCIILKQDFQAFIILSIGIEFLGSFIDSGDFNDFGLSKSRFTNSIEHWFTNKWYKSNKTWMFENLRGPLIHQYRPGPNILLTSKCKNNVEISRHLEKSNDKIIFVLEQLFEDFKNACKKIDRVFNKKNSPYSNTKASEKYLSIYEIENWDKTKLILSGQNQTVSVSIKK